jgi:hypothetical protein
MFLPVIQIDPGCEPALMSAKSRVNAGGGGVPDLATDPIRTPTVARKAVRAMDGSGRGDDWERGLRDRLIAGDESAVADLYDQYASFVFGLAR